MALNVIACKIDDELFLFVKKQPLTASEYLRGLLLKEYENSRTTGGKPTVNHFIDPGLIKVSTENISPGTYTLRIIGSDIALKPIRILIK
jgi:hypothetical protein